jgi:anti-sigma regulatory factor (Ser/Thr protein kinase)
VAEHWRGEIGLAGDPTSAREARAFVRMALADRVSAAVLQDVLLVASEVVTNVIRHARTPLTVNLEIHSDVVRVVVTDGAVPFGNRDAMADDDAESGRGIGIIAAICRDWGVGDTPIGKSIWAEIPIA